MGLCVVLLGAGARAQTSESSGATVTVLPVHVHVAQVDGAPVVGPRWLDAQVESANRVFAPARVAFLLKETSPLDARHADLITRRDRHRLGAYLSGRSLHWFVVRSLMDVDEPGRVRRGVHWRPRGYGAGAHFVIVSSIAASEVLAHELGHFFGNRRHPKDVLGNIMSYERGPGPGSFDPRQLRRVRRSLGRFLRNGELLPVGSESAGL